MATRTFDDMSDIAHFHADLPPASSPELPSPRYGEGRRPKWSVIAFIAAAHGLLLVALVCLDVVPLVRHEPELTVVTLIPDPIVPPPAAPPPAEPEPVQKARPVLTPVVTPPPIVAKPVSAVTIASVPTPPPPVPTAEAPAAASSPVAAPVTPPDGTAATLGNPAPRYPLDARRKHEEGTVRLRVVITSDGIVKDIAVARSSGSDSLDEAALRAVRKWKFKPGLQAGVPVEAIGYLNIPFKLNA